MVSPARAERAARLLDEILRQPIGDVVTAYVDERSKRRAFREALARVCPKR